jgi:hypothetical protein
MAGRQGGRRTPGRVLVVAAGAALLAAPPAAARSVPLTVHAVAACPAVSVNVRLADGSVAAVRHARPGPRLRTIGRRTHDLYLVVRVRAMWGVVKRPPGHVLRLDASGPRGERWRWSFRVVAANPERDPTPYVACLRPLTRAGSFAGHLRTRPGSWRFAVAVTRGALRGSNGSVVLPVR